MYFLVDSFKFYPSLFLKGSLECTDPCGLHMQAILAFIPFSTLAKKGHFVAYICELQLPLLFAPLGKVMRPEALSHA